MGREDWRLLFGWIRWLIVLVLGFTLLYLTLVWLADTILIAWEVKK